MFPAAKALVDFLHAVQVANLQSVVDGPHIDFFRIGLAKRVVGAFDGSTFTVALGNSVDAQAFWLSLV